MRKSYNPIGASGVSTGCGFFESIKRCAGVVLAMLLAVTQVAGGIAHAQIADTEAPVVIHRQAESPGVAGELQTFLARVSDDYEVASVTLFYRQSPVGEFQQIPMRMLLDSLGEYMIAIETDQSEYPGLQYYIEASDTSGNTASRGFSYAPIVLPLEPSAEPLQRGSPAPIITQAPPAPSSGQSEMPSGILMGLGALLVLGVLAGAGGGSGGSTGSGDTVTLTIVSDGPTAN